MKKRTSAGLLMYRIKNGAAEVLLAHPGGPYFAKKDGGHWSIPKGEPDDEDLIIAAMREFNEETGLIAQGDFIPLGSIIQKGGKEVHAWAVEGDFLPGFVHTCNTVEIEWPPRSRKFIEFPEIDKIEFFTAEDAKKKIKTTQIPFIERLLEYLEAR
ncbi:MAG: NUDIX domain-containing protein [Chlorobi bacterium]|nr:NUDIX domain-containing protein [Chlorobiota bacterium]